MSKIQVIGLGAMNMDYLCQVERIIEDGEAPIRNFVLSPGGSAANTVYGLAKLGVKTGFVGAVGEDDDGDALVGSLELAGVDVTGIRTKPDADTGKVISLSDSLGRRSLYVLPGANNLLAAEDIDMKYLNRAKLVHISAFADTRQLDVSIRTVKDLATSVKVSFAPGALYAGLGLKRIASILEKTHVLFINRDEVRQLTGQDIMPGARSLLKTGCKIVVVTLGGGTKLKSGRKTITAASYVASGKDEYFVPLAPERMKIVDTLGAGDAFAAGFLYGLLNDKTLDECGRLGDLVARFSMTKPGARQGLPIRRTLLSTYRRLYGA